MIAAIFAPASSSSSDPAAPTPITNLRVSFRNRLSRTYSAAVVLNAVSSLSLTAYPEASDPISVNDSSLKSFRLFSDQLWCIFQVFHLIVSLVGFFSFFARNLIESATFLYVTCSP